MASEADGHGAPCRRMRPSDRICIQGTAGPGRAAAAEAGAPRSDAPVLNEVTVKASGLGLTSADMSTPATVLEGDVLTLGGIVQLRAIAEDLHARAVHAARR